MSQRRKRIKFWKWARRKRKAVAVETLLFGTYRMRRPHRRGWKLYPKGATPLYDLNAFTFGKTEEGGQQP
jgi:hypothetical protein